ncbi:hypothetical protein [Micromonospora sp. LH3U1]|uniref:hypothetical protein n=1 Tax=Micromonospora sp. LH3U1 TaxID=3018339 RepID=UPI00234BE46A|nr:hypothetical protein [Micromonospora sp. LH3U1]WCN81391.1 hypothetical protein PCA76_31800 [Micromonospora sp. LH3U1]
MSLKDLAVPLPARWRTHGDVSPTAAGPGSVATTTADVWPSDMPAQAAVTATAVHASKVPG